MTVLKNVCIYLSNTNHWHLVGNAYNDERFMDDTLINTSRIEAISYPTSNSAIITTKRGHSYYIKAEDCMFKFEQLAEVKI